MTATLPAPASVPAKPRRHLPGGGLWRAIRTSHKAAVGLVLLLVFTVLAVVPQLFTSVRDPNARAYELSLAPSAHHLLGTTAFGQDVFAQLIWGTRQSLEVGVVVGVLATFISVVMGLSAAYLGDFTDGTLSMIPDVFLVIPTFPLIIVIAAYARKGNLRVIIVVLVVT